MEEEDDSEKYYDKDGVDDDDDDDKDDDDDDFDASSLYLDPWGGLPGRTGTRGRLGSETDKIKETGGSRLLLL